MGIDASQTDIYIRKALAQRSFDKRLEALESLLTGIQIVGSGADAQSLHNSAKTVIRALQPGEFSKAKQAVTAALDKKLAVVNEYALLISREQGHILDSAEGPTSTEPALERALALQPSDPDVQAEIYANLARSRLLLNDQQKTDSFLTQAEKLPADRISTDNREWIARIRARYWLLEQNYEKAYDAAYDAHQIRETDDGSLIGATSLFLLAQEKEKAAAGKGTPEQKKEVQSLFQQAADIAAPLFTRRYPNADGVLMAANHGLGQDTKSRQQLESVIRNNPSDDSAINALMMVCSQYLFDFDCAFDLAKSDATLHDPKGPDAADTYVNLAEAAILARSDQQTQNWLAVALNVSNISPRNKSLAYLYRAWLDARQDQTDQLLTDFQSWRVATEQFRVTKENLNWLFDGARKVLGDSQITQTRKALLVAMMNALEDGKRPLPVWPESATR